MEIRFPDFYLTALTRSGTTLTQSIINCSGETMLSNEVHWLSPLLEMFAVIERRSKLSGEERVRERRKFFDKVCGVTDVVAPDGKWGLQVIGWHNAQILPRLVEIDPSPKMVYLIRDPRDCMLSTIRLGRLSYPTMSPFLWSQVERLRCSARIHLVRYEDVVLHPEETIRSLCEFLKISFSPEMLTPLSRRLSKNARPAIADMEEFKQKGVVDTAVAARWKTQHYDEDLMDMNCVTDHLREAGYQTYAKQGAVLDIRAAGPFVARLDGAERSGEAGAEVREARATIDVHCAGVFGVEIVEGAEMVREVTLNGHPLRPSAVYANLHLLRLVDDAESDPVEATMYTWAHIKDKLGLKPGARIGLYTASDATWSYLSAFCAKGLDKEYTVECIVDSYKTGNMGPYPIVSPEAAVKRNLDLIIITSSPFYKHIAPALEKLGLKAGRDFVGGCFCNQTMIR